MSKAFVFIRVRTIVIKKEAKSFLEFYVELQELQDPVETSGKFVFQWPSTKGRFQSRIVKQLHEFDKYEVFHVSSEAPAQVQKRTLENIKSSGFWISYSDAIPKGGLSNWKVPDLATVYGFVIDFSVTHVIVSLHREQCAQLKINYLDDPIVVQHGCPKTVVKQVVSESLVPSQGMFGTCIQFGNFWKAFRFAVMDQNFQAREGSLFRVYAFWKHLALRTPACKPCQCAVCSQSSKQFGPQSVHYLSDHLATWIREGDAVQTPILWDASKNTYFCKSEEQACLDNSKIFLESVGFVNATAEYLKDRDPLERNLRIV